MDYCDIVLKVTVQWTLTVQNPSFSDLLVQLAINDRILRFLMCCNSSLRTRRNYFGYFSFSALGKNKSLFFQQKTYVSVPAMGVSC